MVYLSGYRHVIVKPEAYNINYDLGRKMGCKTYCCRLLVRLTEEEMHPSNDVILLRVLTISLILLLLQLLWILKKMTIFLSPIQPKNKGLQVSC